MTAQRTLDIGIDLGTTNSVIARIEGRGPRVLKNNLGTQITPSAVLLNHRGTLIVGDDAKKLQDAEHRDLALEWKEWMGNPSWTFTFARDGRSMTPTELSAQVLGSLRKVAERVDPAFPGAAITVPAVFETPSCNATEQAAELAGFRHHPLLMEPVAAALAYGVAAETEKVYWLVYDFGGGTFDAALINMRDGVFRIVNHDGDRHLGGKLIDWDVVTEVFAPAIAKEFKVTAFKKENEAWARAFAGMKAAAEEAKIRLTHADVFDVDVPLGQADENGSDLILHYELRRADLERLAEPHIRRTVHLCRRVLEEKNLGGNDIEKTLLVGGSTLMPYVRQYLEDPKDGLGIPISTDCDPLTVVAEGAAIFAAGYLIDEGPDDGHDPTDTGAHTLELSYRPTDLEVEPEIGGRIVHPEVTDFTGYTLQFTNITYEWQGAPVPVNANGTFRTTLFADGRGVRNMFNIELHDAGGSRHDVTPAQIPYTIIPPAEQTLVRSIGIGQDDNTMYWIARKGDTLPIEHTQDFRTTTETDGDELIKIPLMEGESDRASRNMSLTEITVSQDAVARGLPIRSLVEIRVHISTSRKITMEAFVPVLDRIFPQEVTYEEWRLHRPDAATLSTQFTTEKERLDTYRAQAERAEDPGARQALQRIDDEQVVTDLEGIVAKAGDGPGDAERCEDRIREFQIQLDRVEDALAWPNLVQQARDTIAEAKRFLEHSDLDVEPEERRRGQAIEREINAAIEARNTYLLKQKTTDLFRVYFRVLIRHDGFWVGEFQQLESQGAGAFTDPAAAQLCFSQGNRAIHAGDVQSLIAVVRQLWQLSPAGGPVHGFTGSTVRTDKR